jgi:hypothetical protein
MRYAGASQVVSGENPEFRAKIIIIIIIIIIIMIIIIIIISYYLHAGY